MNSINEKKNASESIANINQRDEKVKEFRNYSGEKGELKFLKSEETLQESSDSIRKANTRLLGKEEHFQTLVRPALP